MSIGESHGVERSEPVVDLGHVASGVGHHVINAFSAIVSSAELLRLDPSTRPPGEQATLADTIIETALKAATVARRLIDYTRPLTSVDAGAPAADARPIALDRLLDEFLPEARSLYSDRIDWRLELGEVPSFRGHAEHLRVMVLRLLDNAAEAIGRSAGAITIRTELDTRGWVALEVHDTGAGMPMAVLERAVEPFFSTKPGHLGVGLSIAHGIWRRHRGTLALQSQPGEGTMLRLCVEPAREGV
ncbi:MAG: sensor histidine kinase [Thermoleophilia bacterium]|nr:sensor histidine kinase [Thermoleophilia bacterium]